MPVRGRLQIGFILLIAVVVLSTFIASSRRSTAQGSNALLCNVTKITSSDCGSTYPSISRNGSRIAFDSTCDPNGHNGDHNVEIFLYDAGTGSIEQITFTEGLGTFSPILSADGSRMAFVSPADLTGNNPDGKPQIFIYEISTHTFTEIPDSSAGLSFISLNEDGKRVAFSSTHDGPENYEIFLYDAVTGTVTQLTDTDGYTDSPSINADGTRIAFISTGDLTGNNSDHNEEIFQYDVLTQSISQVTFSTLGSSRAPLITDDGKRIIFASTINDGKNGEIYLYDTVTGSTRQLTVTGCNIGPSSISGDGSRIALASTCDLTGENTDHDWEFFLYDTITQSFTQITHSVVVNDLGLSPKISRDGNSVAFDSLDSGSADVYLASCSSAPQPSPSPSPSPSPCSVTACSFEVPPQATIDVPLQFHGTTVTTDCFFDPPIYDWDFGDGTPHSSLRSPSHVYTAPGRYTWTMRVRFPNSNECIQHGEIIVRPPCIVSDSGPADTTTKLLEDENDFNPLGPDRTPVILIHGNHGNAQDGIDDIERTNGAYFGNLRSYLDTPEFKAKYKIYRFHYVSDRNPAVLIARALRTHIDRKICDDVYFDKPLILIAHSMGGLIARYYMNDFRHAVGNYEGQRGGERVLKLITLGTPHHGSPGANENSLNQLASNKLWRLVLGVTSFYYWRSNDGKVESTVPYFQPNRFDLLWDNFDDSVNNRNPDINVTLRQLNETEKYLSKMSVYYGFIALDDPLRQLTINLSRVSANSPGTILVNAIAAKNSGNVNSQLIVANVMLGYGTRNRFALNDGLVPVESAAFFPKSVKRTVCSRYDHAMLKDGRLGVTCQNGLTLFESIKRELGL